MPSMEHPEFLCNSCKQSIRKNDTFWVTCPKCGKYGIVETLAASRKDEAEKKKCSVIVRRYWESNKEPLLLHSGNFKQTATEYDKFSLSDKIANYMHYISNKTTMGTEVQIDNNMYYITPSIDEHEFAFIWRHLKEIKLIDYGMNMMFSLTFKGWEYVLSDESIVVPNQGFMAMSFTDPEVKSDYDNIISGILEELDLKPVVLLNVEHNEDAVMEIQYHIKRSAFVIVDVRGQKTNVYYEAGYAKGLGREVIWLCPEEKVNELPFDTRNLNHIVWKTKEEMAEKLRKRIMGTVLS